MAINYHFTNVCKHFWKIIIAFILRIDLPDIVCRGWPVASVASSASSGCGSLLLLFSSSPPSTSTIRPINGGSKFDTIPWCWRCEWIVHCTAPHHDHKHIHTNTLYRANRQTSPAGNCIWTMARKHLAPLLQCHSNSDPYRRATHTHTHTELHAIMERKLFAMEITNLTLIKWLLKCP